MIVTLFREAFSNSKGERGEKVRICNSTYVDSHGDGTPNLKSSIVPKRSVFNSWSERTYTGPDGEEVTLKKDQNVSVMSGDDGSSVINGSLYSLRDTQVWVHNRDTQEFAICYPAGDKILAM